VLIRRLYAEHGGALLAYATRLAGDRAVAEDVVQETLVRAWRNPEALANNKGSVRGWLFTITRNIVMDKFRAKAARPTEVAESPSSTPVQSDHADDVLDALDRLSPEHRDVLTSIYYKGHSVEETAKALGVAPGTVKSRSYYALRRLRETFASTPAATPGQVANEAVAG
jgi:RNA polymerase sigma-70 factor (ECF subfamily)